MTDPFNNARKRQLARLDGTRPPTARAAMALAKSQAYQDAADAPATLRAYAADLANYKACLSGCRTQPQHVVRGHRPSLEVKHLFVRQTLLCYIATNNAVSRRVNRA